MTKRSLPSIALDRQTLVQKIFLLLLVVASVTLLGLAFKVSSAEAASKVIGFSARLKKASGSIAPDGLYNIRFKLYDQASGGTAIWTETYYDSNGASAGQDNRVKVVNGYLSVKLGSQTDLPNIDWSGNLWLTMDIGGTSQESIISNIGWDGEMSPRIQLTAVPYALSAGSLDGKKADDFIQLGQGSQTDSSNNTSLSINKTGDGNFVQLQSAGADALTINQDGNITLGALGNPSIKVGSNSTGVGYNLAISAGDGGGDNNAGGKLVLQGGSATGLDANGGGVDIDSGAKTGSGSGGQIALGAVNAENISIGNDNSTTTVGGDLQANNLDTSQAGALELGGSNATSIFLGQDTSIASGKTLSVHGDTTIQSPSGDSTKTFQVQNNSGASQLTVDTQNNKVSIGQSDTSGTLLVLDSKTSEGDPSGIDGAMYYNSHSNKFRCYENGAWKDCITPLPVSKVATSDTTNDTTTPKDVGGLSFALSPNTKYYYKFVIMHEADDEMTGVGFGVTTPDTPELSNWCVNTSSNLGVSNEQWGSYCGVGDASATTSGETGVGTKFTSTMEGFIETKQDGGNLTLRMKSQTNNVTTVKAGSFGILQIVQ